VLLGFFLSFTGFYGVLQGFTRFNCFLTGFYWVFTRFDWI